MAQYTFIIQTTINFIILSEWGKGSVRGGQVGVGSQRDLGHQRVSLVGSPPGGGPLRQVGSHTHLVMQVLAALDKAIGYYEKNYEILKFDGMFGAKVVEGQLNLLVAEYNNGFLSGIMDNIMKNDISGMAARAGRVVKLAIPYLHEKEPEYMKRLKRIFQLSWDIGHSHRTVDMSLLWSNHVRLLAQPETLNELESDHCMAELLEPVNGMMCHMTESCQRMMTTPGREKYALSHQILYTMVAEMSGCGSRLEQWLVKHKRSGSVEQLQGEMCSNLYSEALSLATAMFTDNILTFRDLLLEMEFICGMLGYVEFLKRDWLIGIFQWQRESGCFPATEPYIGRKLLSEEKLPDGCLLHLTAVASSALSVHLRYLLYPGYEVVKVKEAATVVSPLPLIMQPPLGSFQVHTGSGVLLNQPLFREDIPSGLSRVAEQDKSLEDKADIVLKHLEEMKSSIKKKVSITQGAVPLQSNKPGVAGHSDTFFLPEQTVPLAQYLSSTTSGMASHVSMGPFYFVIASIALVIIVMLRYVHAKRRAHSMFRNRFRL
ncbi:UPF0764 protein C16orf89 homolog [Procambarus clarkii]|uniref:UPF0764 protein C16orf89 homolog n=1 Tax=Procambarus clarkii TaxID=6728 RepID=UPI001E6715DC|nr:UPF0764 protein C16orf89 homolog [Procambarus clarkii]